MGRRGPPPKGEYGGKIARTAVLSTRLQPDTRARLEAAKKASGRSLSQELEHRLRRSFIEDDKAVEFYGTEQNAAVVRLIGATIQSTTARISTEGKHEWLKEQWLFDDVMDAIAHVLLWFRPGGDGGRREITLSSGTHISDQLINEIRSSDPSLPISKRSNRQHAMAMLKEKLGDLAQHQHPYDVWLKKELPVRIAVPNRAKRKNK
jgi:TraY domain